MEESPFQARYPSFDNFVSEVFSKLVEGTRIANNFPAEDDFKYHATNREFSKRMKDYGSRLLGLIQRLLDREGQSSVNLIDSADVDEADEKFGALVDVVDNLIERVDTFVDEAKGSRDVKVQVKGRAAAVKQGGKDVHIFYGSNITRPQDKWKDEIDNSYDPFIPRITSKPNAKVPLDKVFTTLAPTAVATKTPTKISKEMESHLSSLGVSTGKGDAAPNSHQSQIQKAGAYPHPYDHELRTLEYSTEQLVAVKERIYGTLEATPCHWVDTVEQLTELAHLLESQKEIAIDLEHHQYRSFQGITCLMQISTRDEDYLVDTLELRKHLHILNSSFTNPKIVKVIHGADFDILWLQKDFGLYVVNMFDTGQASRVLDFPSYALAYLLKQYCSVTADKKYQLADWRVRPIPTEMLRYAREDTHYLLYIYDRLKNEAIARSATSQYNLLNAVLTRSRDLCLKKYEKDEFSDDSYLKLYNKYNVVFNQQQLRVFAALYNWRDKTARAEDESTRYVLPNHMLFNIAEHMPEEMDKLLGCCNPVPPPVRVYIQDIVHLIRNAKSSTAPLPGLDASGAVPAHPQGGPGFHPAISMGYGGSTVSFGSQPAVSSNASPSLVGGASFPSNAATGSIEGQIPVIYSTEQLIREAGWVDDDDEEHPIMPGGLGLGSGSIGMFREASFSSLNKDLNASVPLKNSLFAGDDDPSDEEYIETKKTAEAIRRSFALDLFSPIKLPDGIEDTLAPSKRVKPEPFSLDMSDLPVETPVEPSVSSPISSSAIPVPKPRPTLSTAPTQPMKQSPEDSTAAPDEFANIPQSMAEIYKLSNQNKKRKKTKKKETREDGAQRTPDSPFYLNDGDSEVDIRAANKRQKVGETADEESVRFMREIGWIQPGEETPPRAAVGGGKKGQSNSAHHDDDQPPSPRHSEKEKSGSFTPFDYNKHGAPAPANAPANTYNPYGNVKSFRGSGDRGGRGGRGGGRGGHQRQKSTGDNTSSGFGGNDGNRGGGHFRQKSAGETGRSGGRGGGGGDRGGGGGFRGGRGRGR